MPDLVAIEGIPQLLKEVAYTMKAVEHELTIVLDETALKADAQAKELCPVDTGRLRASIRPEKADKFTRDVVTAAEYAADVEFGTAPHVITPKSAKILAWKSPVAQNVKTAQPLYKSAKTGKLIKTKKLAAYTFAKRVSHPGTKAQPFMRPAFEAVRSGFVSACEQIAKKVSA